MQYMYDRVVIGREDLILNAMQTIPNFANHFATPWPEESCEGDFRNYRMPHVITTERVETTWDGARLFSGTGGGELLMNTEHAPASLFGGVKPPITTQSHWKIECVDQPQSATGIENSHYTDIAFEAVDTQGWVYSFNYAVTYIASRASVPSQEDGVGDPFCSGDVEHTDGGPGCPVEEPHFEGDNINVLIGNTIMLPTEIKDVHGNWVKYEYSGRHLTKIHANDGRIIDIEYDGDGSGILPAHITSVKTNAGTLDERVWTYDYSDETAIGRVSLTSVTRPDDTSWGIDLPLRNFGHARNGYDQCNFTPYASSTEIGALNIDHPNGVKAKFEIGTIEQGRNNVPGHFRSHNLEQILAFDLEQEEIDRIYCQRSFESASTVNFAVIEKELTIDENQTSVWTCDYQQDDGVRDYPNGLATNDLRKTEVTDPVGNKMVYFYDRRFDSPTEGELMKMQVFDNADALQSEEIYSYTLLPELGKSGLAGTCVDELESDGPSTGCNAYNFYGNAYTHNPSQDPWMANKVRSQTVTHRDGDSYTSAQTYNVDMSSPNYSFGLPITERMLSSQDTATRGTDTVYKHEKPKWILGLVETVSEVGSNGSIREIASFTYNALGQKLSQTRYGVDWASFTYHTSGDHQGQLHTVTDAIDRITEVVSWKRGKPEQIIRPDTESLYQTIDDNGWVTEQKDAKGQTTAYDHDAMGRLKTIDPPVRPSHAAMP